MASASEGKGDLSGTNTASVAPPTFLNYDPYSGNQQVTRPTSSYSSTTDGMSGFSGPQDDASAVGTQSNIPASTGPVGEPGLPPSRPMNKTPASETKRRSLPPGSRNSRIGFGGAADTGTQGAESGIGGNVKDSVPTSNTHVSTIPQQNFFRPMSGQRLQAQRNQTRNSGIDQHTGHSRSYSNASLNTVREGRPLTHDEDAPPLPMSRGTMSSGGDFVSTDPSLKTYGSTTPLHSRLDPINTTAADNFHQAAIPPSEKTPKSPLSFRNSFGLGTRPSRPETERRATSQHEKLGSQSSYPRNAEKELAAIWSEPPKYSGKNYEYWAGNVLFFFAGRCMNTKAWPLNVATFFLMALPIALFFAFSSPWLWHNLSPAIPIIFAYFVFVTFSSFLHASLSDPGILPRNLHPHPPNPEEEHDALAVPPTTEWIMVKTFPARYRSPLPGRENGNDGEDGHAPGATAAMEVPTKYCKTCHIWRPPRTHHCRTCDACIDTQDHHCVWLNNCVGRRNYRSFFTYVAFATTTTILLLVFAITHVVLYGQTNHISFLASLTGRTQERVAFAVFLYGILALPYPALLFFYHMWLISRGETTREYLNSHKFQLKDRHRPFTQASRARNFVSILVRPRPPTYLQFKHRHEEGDVRFGYDARKKDRRRDLKKRYSVQRPGENGERNDGRNGRDGGAGSSGVEMKKLATNGSSGAAKSGPQRLPSKGAGVLNGHNDATPRP